jgi:hypothetical protein
MKRISIVLAFPIIFSSTYGEPESTDQLAAAFDQTTWEQTRAIEPRISALISRIGQVIYRKAVGEMA